ncbi:hypothetical protein PRIPAC_95323, partial [Pristionchus pacificus]
MGSYRLLLVAFACGDILVSAYHAFAFPNFVLVLYQFEYGIIVFTMAALQLPESIGFYVNTAYAILFYEPFILLAFHFVYRYLVLVRPRIIQEHGCALTVLAVAVNILFNCSSIGICFLCWSRQGRGLNMRVIFAVCIAVESTSCAFAVSVVCAVRIVRSISTTSMSAVTRRLRLQLQLLQALVAQFTVPLILCIIPIAFIVLLPFTGRRFGDTGTIMGTAVALFPAIDPIVVIMFRLTLVQYYVRVMGNVPGVTALMAALIQFTAPLVLCIIPTACIVVLPFTGRRFGDTGSVMSMAVALFPATDPIMAIVMIA